MLKRGARPGLCCFFLIVAGVVAGNKTTGDDCGVLVLHSGGFGSQINLVVLSMLVYPQEMLFVNEENLDLMCTSEEGYWNRIFEGDVRGIPKHDFRSCSMHQLPLDPMYEMHRQVDSNVFEGEDIFKLKGEALKKLWKLSAQIRRKVDAHVSFVTSLPKPLIAVHVRQGDKYIEDAWRKPYGPVDFARAALSNPEARNGTCLIYGDDFETNHATARQLVRLLSCTPIVFGGSFSGHDQAQFNARSAVERCQLVDMLITEVEGMAKADYFIGSLNSNIGRLVAMMRVFLNDMDPSTTKDVFDMAWHPYKL